MMKTIKIAAYTLLLMGVTMTAYASSLGRIVDLTHTIVAGMPMWPGAPDPVIERVADYDSAGYRLHTFEMIENTGTHVDVPSHFIKGGRSISDFAASELVVPAAVIDVRTQAKSDPDYTLSAEDVRRWEADHGTIQAGNLVILHTGWGKKFGSTDEYRNQDSDGVMHFPGFGEDAATLLVKRGVVGIGIDTLSLDPGNSTTFAVHGVMLGNDKYQIENLANLEHLPATGAMVIVGVMRIKDVSQAPARVLAMLP